MEYDPTRMCELLVGLGDVEVLSVDDGPGEPLGVHVRCRAARPACGDCGGPVWSDGERCHGRWCWWTSQRSGGLFCWCELLCQGEGGTCVS